MCLCVPHVKHHHFDGSMHWDMGMLARSFALPPNLSAVHVGAHVQGEPGMRLAEAALLVSAEDDAIGR